MLALGVGWDSRTESCSWLRCSIHTQVEAISKPLLKPLVDTDIFHSD